MKKYLFILIILGLATPLAAMAGNFSGPLVPCGREGQSMCTLCDLFTMVQTIIDFVSAGIIVLAVIFITFGGFMILLAGANPGNMETGKKIITNAVIGVIIALLAWTVINVIFNTLVSKDKDRFPAPWNKIECVGGGVMPDKICTCGENKMIGTKEYASGTECFSNCDNYCETTYGNVIGGDYGCCSTKIMENGCFASAPTGEWCKRTAPEGSNKWKIGGPMSTNQFGDANASLVNFINCMYNPLNNGLPNLIITAISSAVLCNNPDCDTSTSNCGHAANSCHFGGTNCKGGSSAVDFALINNSYSCTDIARVARFCGDSNAWINYEVNHVHISLNGGTCGCNEKGESTPCP